MPREAEVGARQRLVMWCYMGTHSSLVTGKPISRFARGNWLGSG